MLQYAGRVIVVTDTIGRKGYFWDCNTVYPMPVQTDTGADITRPLASVTLDVKTGFVERTTTEGFLQVGAGPCALGWRFLQEKVCDWLGKLKSVRFLLEQLLT